MERVAVLTSGGDAPGMNAAIRAIVRQGRELGLQVFGINHGYKGLLEGDIEELGVKDVSGIIERGGTFLQSKRAPEFQEQDAQDEGVRVINQHEIDGLIVIGGDGSLRGARALSEEGIPAVGIPATIDNDVYGTDISIGVDSALNMVVDALDRIRDTAASLERAFVVETMGRESGYIALMGGLSGGAEIILIPEIDYDLEEVAKTIYRGYKRGKQHTIIVVAEGVYEDGSAAHYVGERIRERIGFEMRITVLGHMQRGGSPSAQDRSLASRLGARAVQRLDQGDSGKMMGISGEDIVTTSFEEVFSHKKDLDLDIYNLAQVISK